MHIRWRGLELPNLVTCDSNTLSETYGKFVAEPFERGFGVTIGNGLRRILLSSLEGSAVTQIKVQGAQHEFTTLPGVVEDMTDVVLNIKSLVVKNFTDSTKVVRIEKNTRGPVTGADVQTDETVEVINKDHVLATLTDDVPFVVEMVVENGRGYIPASEHSPNVQEIGIIPIDAVYSPVVRVRYEIEETRVGQKTNYDKLTLEIWTNGTVTPEMAMVEASKILRKHLNPFVQYFEIGQQVASESASAAAKVEEDLLRKLRMPLNELDLSVRASNCLESAKLGTVADLVQKTENDLLKVRSFGKTSLREVKRKIAEMGLTLGMELPEELKTATA